VGQSDYGDVIGFIDFRAVCINWAPWLLPGCAVGGQVVRCAKNRRRIAAIVSGLPEVCAESWFSPGSRGDQAKVDRELGIDKHASLRR
jgi:hypothetical protein